MTTTVQKVRLMGLLSLGALLGCPEPGIKAAQIDAVPEQVTALRKEEAAKLGSYQHVDTSAGVVRIPVARA